MARRGFVLPAAIIALLLVSALVVSVTYAAVEQTRMGEALRLRAQTLVEAETALTDGASQIPVVAAGLSVGGTVAIDNDANAGRVVYITRLDSATYFIVADVERTDGNTRASRRVAILFTRSTDQNGATRIERIPDGGWSELF